MKLFLVAFCLFLGAVVNVEAELGDQLEDPLKQCAAELKLGDVSVFTSQNIDAIEAKMAEPQFKCLPQCVLQKVGAVGKDGKWDAEGAKKMYDGNAEVEAAFNKCVADSADADTCDQNKKIIRCLFELH